MILFFDTATDIACAGLAAGGTVRAFEQNPNRQDHAAWLHLAIERLLTGAGTGWKEIEAIAITAGPGSYTGLRVAMATAKGLCYALKVPLILENTLRVMAHAAQLSGGVEAGGLLCPMIDARRMEVFTAVYDQALDEIVKPAAVILEKNSFDFLPVGRPVYFFGSGQPKWEALCETTSARFLPNPPIDQALAALSEKRFRAGSFADIAYSEPDYGKEFYTHAKK